MNRWLTLRGFRSLPLLWHSASLGFLGLLMLSSIAEAQTRLRLSTILPGSERVQLVYNGDFQAQGPLSANLHPFPIGWTRQAEMYADAGLSMAAVNQGVVARGLVSGGAAVGMFKRSISLEANTAYVLSAYLWNMGDSANYVHTVVDLNDAPQEAQLTLYYSDPGGANGYFLYQTFNTANTGTNVVLRVFYDGLTGTGAAAAFFPVTAQWDNIGVTKLADFSPPQPLGSGANLRPLVGLSVPADLARIVFQAAPAVLAVTASASDLDGSIEQVDFYDGVNRIGQAVQAPYTSIWSNVPAGAHRLTAGATDNSGAITLSAPVNIIVSVPQDRTILNIAEAGPNVALWWPTSATAFSLRSADVVSSSDPWPTVTNASFISSNQQVVLTTKSGAQQFFRLGAVDPSTLTGKLMMGYQGWFACTNDGSPVNRWVHWFRNNTPTATNATIDFWPDTSELQTDELFATGMHLTNGSPAKLYSAYKEKTVVRHFRWMKEHNLDGVFLQRFSSELSSGSYAALRNQVLANVRTGAETYGRIFAVMYDISGQNPATLVNTLLNDWSYLAATLQITNSPSYVRHRGRPVVAIWGFGFNDRPGTPQDALAVIGALKAGGLTVMGGVPTYWRTLRNDSQTNAAWAEVYRAFDIVSPWAVGRFSSLAGADTFRQNLVAPDLLETTARGLDYMPVVFPGFSWYNLNSGAFNQIPRQGGIFYWRQVYNAVSAGCTMLYGAMFDEVDEGTAMFKLAPTLNELPVEGRFVPLNIDGQQLPSDWYLRVADHAGRMLRREIPLQLTLPISP